MSNEPDRKPEAPEPEFARQEPNPPESTKAAASPGERRWITWLALGGLAINGIIVPAVVSLLTDPSAVYAFIVFQLVFQLVIWAIVLPIGLHLLRRRGFKTALVFMIVAVIAAGLPFLSCLSLLGG